MTATGVGGVASGTGTLTSAEAVASVEGGGVSKSLAIITTWQPRISTRAARMSLFTTDPCVLVSSISLMRIVSRLTYCQHQ